MIVWLFAKLGMAALPDPLKKVIVYLVLGAVGLWAFKVFWLNPHDQRVADETKAEVTEKVKKEEEARWKPLQEELKKQNEALARQIVTIQAQIVILQESRQKIENGLAVELKSVKAQEAENRSKIDAIPIADLQKSVEALSAQLAGTGTTPKDDPKQVLGQLFELQSLRAQVAKLEDFVRTEKATYEQEKAQWQALIDGKEKATGLAIQALELEKQKSALFQTLYDAAKHKKCGVGGWLKRIFTLGIARCR